MNSIAFRFILFVDGFLLIILSAAMMIPMLLDAALGNPAWRTFAASAGVTGFVGGAMVLAFRGSRPRIERRTGYLLTVSAWTVVCSFGALPLHFSDIGLSFTDAFFESMSGLTTTGSTVLVGLDTMAPGLLLWRSLMTWIGGVGIVVMAIIMLPALNVGGMQLFRTESSDISEKMVPRPVELAGLTVAVYIALSIACTIAYAIAGMNTFDAVNHAMTTVATGGFSTKDASIGFYDSVPIEIVGIVFMIAGSLPLIWYAQIIGKRGRGLAQERQMPIFLGILAVAVLLATLWNVAANDMAVHHALRISAFNVTSIITSTGYVSADYSAWGSFAMGLFFLLMFIGGCAGSTAGGVKIFRWQILFSGARRQLGLMLSPHRVLPARYGERAVDTETLHSVRNFFFMYLATFGVLSMAVMATGLDFLSSTSAVAQAMGNTGPGLGPVVGPATNFASISDAATWLLSLAMLLGRLELSTLYVLLLADYWRA